MVTVNPLYSPLFKKHELKKHSLNSCVFLDLISFILHNIFQESLQLEQYLEYHLHLHVKHNFHLV